MEQLQIGMAGYSYMEEQARQKKAATLPMALSTRS